MHAFVTSLREAQWLDGSFNFVIFEVYRIFARMHHLKIPTKNKPVSVSKISIDLLVFNFFTIILILAILIHTIFHCAFNFHTPNSWNHKLYFTCIFYFV